MGGWTLMRPSQIASAIREAAEDGYTVRPVVFYRAEGFYVASLLAPEGLPAGVTPQADLAEHVRLNPGTLKVEDALTGEILWSAA